ncbi:hypothetical protein ABQF35_29545 [Mycobacterium syngnathidarum]
MIAGLMLYCGLRSTEVLGLDVTGVDIGGRWLTSARASGNATSPRALSVRVCGAPAYCWPPCGDHQDRKYRFVAGLLGTLIPTNGMPAVDQMMDSGAQSTS